MRRPYLDRHGRVHLPIGGPDSPLCPACWTLRVFVGSWWCGYCGWETAQ